MKAIRAQSNMPYPFGLHLAIDASNIRQGGGITHLSQLLQSGDPISAGFQRVTIWVNRSTSLVLPDRTWLVKMTLPWMESTLPHRLMGQQLAIPQAMKAEGCDVLLSTGGTLPFWSPVPAVTMSQNMLPFEPLEAARFGRYSLMRFKMRLLRHSQGRSFRRADGLIFLTQYAKSAVSKELACLSCPTALIPHGIENRFMQPPRSQRLLTECSIENPFRILYVSILMPYKHQIEVAHAASQLRASGLPIEVRFIGEPWGDYGRQFRALLDNLDPGHAFLLWSGAEPFDTLHGFYQKADAFVFASSCENLPNILLEAMAAGLPIASSECGPMPEILGDAGVYFDPLIPSSIADAVQRLALDHSLRSQLAQSAWLKAQAYSWERCARDTFAFIAQVARQ